MTLFDEQWQFFQDLMCLGTMVRAEGWAMSLRELKRTDEQQRIYLEKGLTGTLNSDHILSLAVDIYFRTPDGEVLVTEKQCRSRMKDLERFAAYWESLSKDNYWGGRWRKPYDPYHFGTKKG